MKLCVGILLYITSGALLFIYLFLLTPISLPWAEGWVF